MPKTGEQKKLGAQIVGNVGLYHVCCRLSLLGWNVMPTSRNARGVDILIYSDDATRKWAIQVKSLSKRAAVPLGNNLERLFGDFFIVCRKACEESPEFFVLTPDEVRQNAARAVKNGKVSYWLQPRRYEAEPFKNKWERIGKGTSIPLPRAECDQLITAGGKTRA